MQRLRPAPDRRVGQDTVEVNGLGDVVARGGGDVVASVDAALRVFVGRNLLGERVGPINRFALGLWGWWVYYPER